jgi:hypothetical protein
MMFVAAAIFAICFGVTAYAMRENGKEKSRLRGYDSERTFRLL